MAWTTNQSTETESEIEYIVFNADNGNLYEPQTAKDAKTLIENLLDQGVNEYDILVFRGSPVRLTVSKAARITLEG